MTRQVDAHSHLTDSRLDDIGSVLMRARAAGVIAVVTCGEDIPSSEHALTIAERNAMVAVAVGIHPHRAATCDEGGLGRLRELARHPAAVAIGEIGIDLSGRSAPLEAQERAFEAQVRLAAEVDLPVVVHVRESGALVRGILDALPKVRGQIHSYSEGPEQVEEWIARGFYLSFSGTLTFPRSERLRAAIRCVPADRLLFETDAPYLAPVPHRGWRNEPAFVVATLSAGARERGTDVDELAARTTANASELFGGRLLIAR